MGLTQNKLHTVFSVHLNEGHSKTMWLTDVLLEGFRYKWGPIVQLNELNRKENTDHRESYP